ncbi:MAG: Mov34/MPN/PAD-1 family protein [Candidatus Hermodarchaeota archaeon]
MKLQENFVFPIYIYEETIESIKLFCRNSKEEIFGYLIGNILKWNERIYTMIEESIFLIGAVYSDKTYTSQIEGTAGLYQKKFQRIKKKKNNQNLRIVGWWHSHPNLGCFLSSTDLLTQKYFFPNEYQVALVIDPVRNEFEFFTIDNNEKKGYKPLSYAVLKNVN